MSGPVVVTHHTATVRDVRLHYVTAGSGEPVVLLHGGPQTSARWDAIIPALAGHYAVIAPDLRGTRPLVEAGGRTTPPNHHRL